MSYVKAKQRYEEEQGAPVQTDRTDYRCRAHGCPNAGCIDDDGEHKRGMCFWHWREPDPRNWPAITQRVRENFEEMRNHGTPHVRSEESRRELIARMGYKPDIKAPGAKMTPAVADLMGELTKRGLA